MKRRYSYLEDYEIGQKGETITRTVTEADVVTCACLTGDYSPTHLDYHFMADSMYGARVAHGVLGPCLVSGLLSQCAPHTVGRGVPSSYLYGFDVNYRRAIKVGDTVRVQWKVAERSGDIDNKGFGLVKTVIHVLSHESNLVYEGSLSTLVKKKTAQDAVLKLKTRKPWKIKFFVRDEARVYYLEDLPVGGGGETDGRTITEADIVNFVGFTGDYNPQYTNVEFAREGTFGERIAPGMLVFSYAFGLWARDVNLLTPRPENKLTTAGHMNDNSTFLAPVKIGDTVRFRYKIAATRFSKSKPELGLVTYAFQIINQQDEVVQEGSTLMMTASKASLQK